jgi:hypothetical protein
MTVDTGGVKQLLFDAAGLAHVALFTSAGRSTDLIYLAFDQQWRMIEHRDFPANAFFGMGIDGYGTVHLAMR